MPDLGSGDGEDLMVGVAEKVFLVDIASRHTTGIVRFQQFWRTWQQEFSSYLLLMPDSEFGYRQS